MTPVIRRINRIARAAALLSLACVGSLYGQSPPKSGASVEIYVSPRGSDENEGLSPTAPLRTLEKAQQKTRELKSATTGVRVNLQGGVYLMSEPLVFGPEDSGAAGAEITYRAESDKVIISGGEQISGWKKHKGNIWVTTLPRVAIGAWDFRQLYVNGEPRVRARGPNSGVYYVKSHEAMDTLLPFATPCSYLEYFDGDINPKWKNPSTGEVIIYHFWTDVHLPIASINAQDRTLHFAFKSRKALRDGFDGQQARYIIENVYEVLDQPGEWMLDRQSGELFYIPMPGEEMNAVEVIAPSTQEFIRLVGNPEKGEWVKHLQFEGISFQYSNFTLPLGEANDYQGSYSVQACINLKGAQNCSFTACHFTRLGGYAFELTEGCTENDFTYNTIERVAAGGFRVTGVPPGGSPLLRSGNNNFSDNTIAHYGLTYCSAVGVLLMHSDCNTIAHNHIHHGDYTGISLGWSWGYLRSATRDNLVVGNHIHDLGINNLLSDMGGVYTLGLSPGTVIRGNLIHDVNANQYGGWGIYMDEGSTSILVENNLVYNTKFGMFNIHYSKDLVVRNNIFAFGLHEEISRERVEPHVSAYFEGNIVYWKQGKLMARDWSNEEHKIFAGYFQGWKDTTATMVCDWNLYYNPTLTLSEVDFNGRTWEQWNEMGRDLHSLYTDPLFVDVEQYDFRLKPESAALQLGFKPLDMTAIGPRKKNP